MWIVRDAGHGVVVELAVTDLEERSSQGQAGAQIVGQSALCECSSAPQAVEVAPVAVRQRVGDVEVRNLVNMEVNL